MYRFETLEQLLGSEDDDFILSSLDEFICTPCQYGEDIDKLNEAQKLFFFNQNVERELNNGGFNQYFWNSSGDFANETIASLKAIGAEKTAALLQQAMDQFPDRKVPTNRDERNELQEQIQEQADDVWNELDEKFYLYEENLNELNLAFIKMNKDSF